MYHSMVQGNEELDEPRWSAQVHGFLPGQSRNSRSSTSIVSRAVTIYEDDESSPLLASGMRPTRRQVSQWTSNFWRRQLVLLILPVAIVIAWCSVPLRTYPHEPEEEDGSGTWWWSWVMLATVEVHGSSDSIALNSTNPLTHINPSTSAMITPAPEPQKFLINFWFFLWFYYGFYNAVALLLITKIFSIYSLNWWPKTLGGPVSYCLFWFITQMMGILIYLFTGLEVHRLTWVFLTFCSMTIPLLVAFLVIRSENRNVFRHSLTVAQKTFLSATAIPSRIPASYMRFLWFCVALAIALSTIVTGELYADQYIESSKKIAHSTRDGLIYVYSWVGTIFILDSVTDYIVETRVRCYPLSSIFKLYYYMIYYIFYRNLFVRLRSYEQFVVIQLASSIWVCVFHPLVMTRPVYNALVSIVGITKTYEEYKRQVGRGLFLRNLSENVTMLAFLLWVNILYYGPNAKVYPYFQFDDSNKKMDHNVTVIASIAIWFSELVSNFVNRSICKRYLRLHVTREALKDLKEYPELIVAFVLIMVHILQDMLLALLELKFA